MSKRARILIDWDRGKSVAAQKGRSTGNAPLDSANGGNLPKPDEPAGELVPAIFLEEPGRRQNDEGGVMTVRRKRRKP